MAKKLTQEEALQRCFDLNRVDEFDYGKMVYVNAKTKVIIICKKCGIEFQQLLNAHLRGQGCIKCIGCDKHTQESALKKCFDINGTEKFDYSKSIFDGVNKKVIIICKKCGTEFKQTPKDHWNKQGCLSCRLADMFLTTPEFIDKGRLTHGMKYNYNKSICDGVDNPVIIICNTCSYEFKQTPHKHISRKQGCPKCGGSFLLNSEEWVEKAKIVPKQKKKNYDFSLVDYKNNKTKVKIICKKEGHGVFEIIPSSFLNGSEGCKKCMLQFSGEFAMEQCFVELNMLFECEKTFDDCRNIFKLPFDFWLSEHNILLEFDGKQHFEPIKRWGGEEGFLKTQKRDAIKNKYAADNGIPLLRISYWEFNNINQIIIEFLMKHGVVI